MMSYEAEMKIDLNNSEWVTDMYWKMDGTQSFKDFIELAVTQITPGRRYGYIRLYLYPTREDFYKYEWRFFAILIRKLDIYVVGVQLDSGEIYEIGRDDETQRYFFNSTPTGFGQQYGELFTGTGINGDLVGTWIGFQVLNDAIIRVIRMPNPSQWAWSIGVFALTFSECIRFVWSLRRVNNLIENKTNIRMFGDDTYMALIPKEWRNMSDCARRNLVPGERTEAQPENEKYTQAGLKDCKRFVRYATDALHIKSWHSGDNDRREHIQPGRGGFGLGFGDGGGRY